jgi:biopolymer transport protein ExbD
MGMQVGKQGGIKNDINVTPLIDVVLVLLIIFLVTMPIMMRTITLEVPRKMTDQEIQPADTKTITITVKADLSVDLDSGDGHPVSSPAIEVATKLRPLLEGKTDKLVFVDFEDPVPWEQVVLVMDSIRSVAADKEHNEVKVALKIRDAAAAPVE